MKGLLRSKLFLSLAAFVMIASAIAVSFAGNIIHSHAQSPASVTPSPTQGQVGKPPRVSPPTHRRVASGDPSGSFLVPATVQWVNTGITLSVGDTLKVSATGSWSADPGDGFTGPDGYTQESADNFLNLQDIGACSVCASTPTPHWGALIGYIGDNPPAAGSYTDPSILPEAQKVFVVGSDFNAAVTNAGTLWLNFNDDAYSGYTVDNAGQVTASITSTTTTFTYPIAPSNVRFTIGYGIQNPSLVGPNGCYWDSTKHQYVPFSQLWHAGEDWFAKTSAGATTISAVANGVVKYVSPPGYSYPGAVIIIQHTLSDGSLVYSMYGHLDPQKLLVKVGDTVTKGQSIASGLISQKSEGGDNTHLHWEIRYFFDGSGITKGPNYKQTCSAQPGPGYTWPGQPDNFVFNGTTYRWTNPSQFVAAHM